MDFQGGDWLFVVYVGFILLFVRVVYCRHSRSRIYKKLEPRFYSYRPEELDKVEEGSILEKLRVISVLEQENKSRLEVVKKKLQLYRSQLSKEQGALMRFNTERNLKATRNGFIPADSASSAFQRVEAGDGIALEENSLNVMVFNNYPEERAVANDVEIYPIPYAVEIPKLDFYRE